MNDKFGEFEDSFRELNENDPLENHRVDGDPEKDIDLDPASNVE